MTDRVTDGVLHLERDYDATPEEVWEAWTKPERMARWLATPAGPLGAHAIRLSFGEDADNWADVTVLAAEPPRRLELEWAFTGDVRSVLLVRIDPLDDARTRVTLEHRDLGASTAGYGAGWEAYLADLGTELGGPSASASWEERFTAALPSWRARL